MSYILDALKKSEQERGHGRVPDVQTVHSSSLNYGNEKKIYWHYILIIAVIMNLLAILYFIIGSDKSSEKLAVATHTEAIEADHLKSNTTDNTSTDIHKYQKKQIITPSLKIDSNTKPHVINNQDIEKETIDNHPATIKSGIITENNDSNNINNEVALKGNSSSEDISNIMDYYDLPEAIKLQLPAIIISAHVYSSNPLQRSIVINNKFMEQGEYVIDDLILHEITSNGAIFDYQGTRFHYGVVSTWQ